MSTQPTPSQVSKTIQDFDTFIERLKEAGLSDLPLIKLTDGWKNPVAAFNLKLADGSLNPMYKISLSDAKAAIANQENIGCYGSPGGLEFHDIDITDGKFVISDEQVQELIKAFDTFTVRTRSGGIDFYFKNSGELKNPHIFYNGKTDMGECRRDWQYVVCVGSYIVKNAPNPDNGKSKGCTPDATGFYEIIHDAPIRKFNPKNAPEWYSIGKKKETQLDKYLDSKTEFNKAKAGVYSDDFIITNASEAKNGNDFLRLFRDGNISGYDSRSEADLSLANRIAFYSNDRTQIERIMRRSRLSRNEKWDRQDYMDLTIGKAIENPNREMYSPGYKRTKPAEEANPLPEIDEDEITRIRSENQKRFGELPELPTGFFRDYMDFGIKMSYAYPAYHFGAALAIVSMVAGRKVCMESTAGKIYPNVFVMIVGQTSISGKSTACDLAYKNFFGLIQQDGIIEDLTKKMSPQGLLQRLSRCASRFWYYDECSEFFSDIQNRWAESLESIMCSVYDGRSVSYGLSEGKGKTSEYRADNVFLSCLWNTTDGEMESRASWSAVTNGFIPRWMFFWCQTETKPRKNRSITDDDIGLRISLEQKIQRLRSNLLKIPGEDMIKFRTNDLIESWRLEDTLHHLKKEDELHRIATARLVPQGYKIAILLSLMDETLPIEAGTYPILLNIPDQHAKLAIRICEEYLRPRLMHVIEMSRDNDTKNYQAMVTRALKKLGGAAKKSQIIRETRINRKNFDETIDSLIEAEVIEECMMKSDAAGRPAVVLKLVST